MCERGCGLVATVGEARMRLFTNYFFGELKHGRHSIGRGGEGAETTFIDKLESDTGFSVF